MESSQELKLFSLNAALHKGEADVLRTETLVPLNEKGKESIYVPVRRMALSLQQSIIGGNKWVVFEPNGPKLWARLQSSVSAFLQSWFLQGKFKGGTPHDAYFVKCDATTMTLANINGGVVNILVGFAPLRPAEFVVIQIQMLTSANDTRNAGKCSTHD